MRVVKSKVRLGVAMGLCATLLTASCGSGDGNPPPVAPVKQDLTVRLDRLDQELFHRGSEPGNALALQAKYGDFFRTYVEDVLALAPVDDPRLAIGLTRFAMDPDWRSVQERADSLFGDMAREQEQFNIAFGRLQAHFPDSLVPRVIIYNSGFNYGVLPTDSTLGVGVEWFIGKDHPVVGLLTPEVFPQYMKERMRPEMLVPSAVKGWLLVHYIADLTGTDLLTHLVETGKVMVLLHDLQPSAQPAVPFAFTDAQLKWCEENEFNCWREIISRELLYSKKAEDIGRFMSDGPFTPGFPKESPGHIGEWIGYRMVRSYLADHPNTTFAQLFAMHDAREVLKSYKPR
ncbi:MAG TPA: hypothetical protein VGE21_07705 [Flavobacteriales bacterium]